MRVVVLAGLALVRLPFLPTLVVQFALLRFALKRIAKCVIFPGCTRIWKFSLQEQLAMPAMHALRRLISRPDFNVGRLDSLVSVLKRQEQNGTLTKSQVGFLDALTKSRTSELIAMIDKNLEGFASRLAPFQNHIPIIHSLDFLRAQMELTLNAKIFTVGQVEVILIPAPPPNRQDHSWDAKVVLFCNPNAGFFETVAVNTEFVDLYAELGYSFCSFNYRGYHRSVGWPSTENIATDAALVLKFLRCHLGFKRVGVHGRSIGGICAVHLGRTAQTDLDFVVADRTFAKLSLAARAMMGRWAEWGVVGLGEDSQGLDSQWMEITKCPKIVIQAENDEIIRPSAALTTMVATRLAKFRLETGVLREVAKCATSLVFKNAEPRTTTVGRAYSLTEDTKNVRKQVRTALAEVLGVPDAEKYTENVIEEVAACAQVWQGREETRETWRALRAVLTESDEMEAEKVKKLLVEPMVEWLEKGEKNEWEMRDRGLLVRTNGGHNDCLSRNEKACLTELIRSTVSENI